MLARPRSRTSLNNYPAPRHRSRSRDSAKSLQRIDPIILLDNTVTPGENSTSLWARSVRVTDYVIVAGGRTRAGAYVLWSCYIDTLEVSERIYYYYYYYYYFFPSLKKHPSSFG